MTRVVAKVLLWDQLIGAVLWDTDNAIECADFEYADEFIDAHRSEPSPITMPVEHGVFRFPDHARSETWLGLPGMLADACPDRFGNQLIDQWLASQGRDRAAITPVERLLYIGKRCMGALSFEPAVDGAPKEASDPLDLEMLVSIAQEVMTRRESFAADADGKGLEQLLQVGTSAGGARAKAVIAWNRETDEIRSGQTEAPEGFSHWLLKFDGVKDVNFDGSDNYCRVEYAYYQAALSLGIEMMESTLIHEGPRAHFVTRRFDRPDGGGKLHLQTLCGLAHYDYCSPGAYSWEQSFQVCRLLGLGVDALEQLYRRLVFNIVFRNQDDHTKNISFLMDPDGNWSLAPAYDVTYAYNPAGRWTNRHQMTAAGKREHFTRSDLLIVAKKADIKKTRANDIIDNTLERAKSLRDLFDGAGVDNKHAEGILPTIITGLAS